MKPFLHACAAPLAFAITALTTLPTAAAPFQIDRFWGERNGAALFSDEFNDGLGPPTGGVFPGTTTALYTLNRVVGNFATAEQGGKLTLDPRNNGVQTVNPFTGVPEGLYFNAAYLNVNTDDTAANIARGLKLSHSFAVHGLFDLDMNLAFAGTDTYGIRLADFDNTGATGWNDVLDLQLARSTVTGDVRLYFFHRDLRLGTRSIIASAALDAALGEQIELSFFKNTVNDPTITAAFRYVQGGVAQGAVQVVGESDAYNGESFTRPGFFAAQAVAQAVPLPGTLALLGAAGLAAWLVRGARTATAAAPGAATGTAATRRRQAASVC